MNISIIPQAEKELYTLPEETKIEVYLLFRELEKGEKLSMPISKPLFSIAKGLHELRLSGKQGEFRVFYFVKIGDSIYILHSCKKKTQKTEQKTINLIKTRIKGL